MVVGDGCEDVAWRVVNLRDGGLEGWWVGNGGFEGMVGGWDGGWMG